MTATTAATATSAAGSLPPDLIDLEEQLDASERDARALVAGLSEARGTWCAEAGSWSVAECLDHLAIANSVYLDAMRESAAQARAQSRLRRGPIVLGPIRRWIVGRFGPRVKGGVKVRAPRTIRPRQAPPLADALARFLASHELIRAFLRAHADLDLDSIRFPNPFVRGLRFSLATGLHIIAAHERRHLWQAWGARRAAEQAASDAAPRA